MNLPDCCAPAAEADPVGKTVVQPDKRKLIGRLNRIEGQVAGVTRMIEADRYCVDILTQVAAIKSALDSVAMQLLHNHAHGCVARALKEGSGDSAIEELMTVVQKLSGRSL